MYHILIITYTLQNMWTEFCFFFKTKDKNKFSEFIYKNVFLYYLKLFYFSYRGVLLSAILIFISKNIKIVHLLKLVHKNNNNNNNQTNTRSERKLIIFRRSKFCFFSFGKWKLSMWFKNSMLNILLRF